MKKSLFICLLIGLLSTAFWLFELYLPVVKEKHGMTYFLRPGTSNKAFIADLQARGVVRFPFLFWLYIIPQKNVQIKTGEYIFPKGSNLTSIWHQVISGSGLVYHAFTIVPGWTFNQLSLELKSRKNLRHISANLTDEQIMQHLGSAVLPEGQFFPETYMYSRGILDLVILKRAYDLMQIKLNEAWGMRSKQLPYKNVYEALIAASLIEKESRLDNERPLIASVLINRLKKDMLLQFDPTVIYGLGSHYDGKIHKANLLDLNRYNTYMHKGLPPTPIAMPSMSAIHAALHPLKTDYLYFVAKGNGGHQFSKTLQEHLAAVAAAKHEMDLNQNQQNTLPSSPVKNSKNSMNRTYFFNAELIQHHLQMELLSKARLNLLQKGIRNHVDV